jgi:hypothetical protein
MYVVANRVGHSRIVDAVSDAIAKTDSVCSQPRWLLQKLNPLGWHVVPWPDVGAGFAVVSAGFACSDWNGNSILAVITAELRPTFESNTAFVSSDESSDSGDTSAAVVPSVFSAKSRSTLHLASVAHGSGANSANHGDLLGLFDVFTPTLPPTEPASPYPFQTPIKSTGGGSVLSSPVRPLSLSVPPPQHDDSLTWHVRLELRSDNASTLGSFAAGVSNWFREFTSGSLRLIRHYSAPPPSSCRQSWQGVAWDGGQPGLFSLCGIGRPPVPAPPPPVVSLNVPIQPPSQLPLPTVRAPPPVPPVSGSHSAVSHDPRDPFGGLFGGVSVSQPQPAPVSQSSMSFEELFPGFTTKK